MNTIHTIKTLGRHMLDLVFPVLCLGCSAEGWYLCRHCSRTLKRDEFQLCPICGSKSPFGRTHPSCRIKFGLDGLISAVPYKEPLARKLVETCKYKFVRDIAPLLAEIMYQELLNQELLPYFQNWIIVPLPLHGTRLKWRGFNQAELIGKKLSELTGLRMQTNLLARQKKTKVQAELQDEERKINVQDAFLALTDLKNKKIVIIDDVSTTRSTLTQACKALKQAGALEVWGIVFAQG